MRSLGVNKPVVLVGNKIDLRSGDVTNAALEEELAPVMSEFKEVETCVECSAKIPLNVSEVFYFAQKAVLYPTAPLYDSREHALKPACVDALRRIFRLCDSDKDGLLSDAELNDFQRKCFDAPLQLQELEGIKDLVLQAPIAGTRFPYDHLSASGSTSSSDPSASQGGVAGRKNARAHPHLRNGSLTLSGFLYLHTLFIQRGRLETTWTVLRTFGYGSDLTLEDSFVRPTFHVPPDCSVELSPHGYQFLTDVFEAHDKDRDGALSQKELESLFLVVPDESHPWTGTDFPHTTITDEHGAVTLQGWLAQWSMTTLLNHKMTLAYLAYLGYPSFVGLEGSGAINGTPGGSGNGTMSTPHKSSTASGSYSPPGSVPRSRNSSSSPSPPPTTTALKLTKSTRKETNKKNKKGTQRNVFLAYVLGAAGSGKTSLLRHMVGKGFDERYSPTGRTMSVVSAVEQDGAERYLVLQEFGSRYEAEALRNVSKMPNADVVVFVYDSSDTNSFSYLSNLRQQFPSLASMPSLFVATKADLDLAQQRHEVQPDVYCAKLGLRIPGLGSGAGPISVSARMEEMADLYSVILAIASDPRGATPGGGAGEGALSFATQARWALYIFAVVLGGGAVATVGMRAWRQGGTAGFLGLGLGLGNGAGSGSSSSTSNWSLSSSASPSTSSSSDFLGGWLGWLWNGAGSQSTRSDL